MTAPPHLARSAVQPSSTSAYLAICSRPQASGTSGEEGRSARLASDSCGTSPEIESNSISQHCQGHPQAWKGKDADADPSTLYTARGRLLGHFLPVPNKILAKPHKSVLTKPR